MPGNFFNNAKTAAFSDYSQSFTEAIKAVFPRARFQADHVHTVKNIGEKFKKSLRSYRRHIQASGEENNDASVLDRAKTLWEFRWTLFTKPGTVSEEAKQAIVALARADEGCVSHFRSLMRQRVTILDHSHSDAQAKLRLQQLRKDIQAVEDGHLEKILQFLDNHGDHAFRYRRKKGMGKHRRGSNAESGMRLLRRLEKNHAGIRSAATRQHYMQIYQALKYLSRDIADFIEKGPQMATLTRV